MVISVLGRCDRDWLVEHFGEVAGPLDEAAVLASRAAMTWDSQEGRRLAPLLRKGVEAHDPKLAAALEQLVLDESAKR